MANKIAKPTSAAGEEIAQTIKTKTNKKPRGQQAKADAAEVKRRAGEMKTQGRNGCKLDRVNLSITPENFEYIKVRSAQAGATYSKAINEAITIVRENAEANDKYYLELRELRRKQAKKEAKE